MVNLLYRLLNEVDGFNSWINSDYVNIYFKEVESDIEILREGMDSGKFERDGDIVFQHFIKKYQEKHCPSTLYEFFSPKTREVYGRYREEIDKIISQKDELFSDFLRDI